MALSGLEIYKYLPKTNCRQCGFPTCLAFALSLAKKAVNLDKCPYISSSAKQALEAQSQPPIKLVTIGTGESKIELGNETVMFRHEEKFRHPAGIGFILKDSLSLDELKEALQKIKRLRFERIGQLLRVELIALRQTGSKDKFIESLRLISSEADFGVILLSKDISGLREALGLIAARRPLIYPEGDNFSDFLNLSKEYNVPLVVKGSSLEELSEKTKQAQAARVTDIIIEVDSDKPLAKFIWELTQLRRLALKKLERSLGYPTIAAMNEKDSCDEVIKAGDCILKYASIVLLNSFQAQSVLPLLTLRQNIYTDPQKPLQIEAKLYQIGNAQKDSPVLVTTNFSLTYYTVLGEVEASKVPSNIVSVDTEGMSVLTAWAAEKFTPDKISESLKKSALEERVSHRNLIIPGYVAVLSGELEEKSGWKVIVGPKEAAGIPSFLKNLA